MTSLISLSKDFLKDIFFRIRFVGFKGQAKLFGTMGKMGSFSKEFSSITFSKVNRTLPRTIELTVHKNFSSQLNLKEKKVSIYSIKNAFIALNEGFIFVSSGGVFNENYLYLPIKSYSKLLTKLFFPVAEEVTSTACVIPGTTNYFHWMFEALPRIMVLKKNRIKPMIVLTDTSTQFQNDTLKLALPPKTKVLPLMEMKSYLVSELIVPLLPQYSGNPSKEVCNYLRSLFLTSKLRKVYKKYEKIYVSRGSAKNKRSVNNESEVIALLEKKGFVKVCMDGLAVADQAKIFSSAKVIVAPHGGALTNLVFCNKGTKVIEIFHPDYVNPCFWAVSNCVELDYSYFVANKTGLFDFDLNMEIDTDKLLAALEFSKML